MRRLQPLLHIWLQEMKAHNLPLSIVGVLLIWFGWFGFNAGSAITAKHLAAQALLNTNLAACTGLCGPVLEFHLPKARLLRESPQHLFIPMLAPDLRLVLWALLSLHHHYRLIVGPTP